MTDTNASSDSDILARNAHEDEANLAVRIHTHQEYTRPRIDFPEWVLDKLPWRGDECVLDIGTGTGNYIALVHERAPNGTLIGGDLSLKILQQARAHAGEANTHLTLLDAQRLPFPDETFDVVLANHMLYHVGHIPSTLDEIKRVLCPDGCLVTATNSAATMEEFDTLARRACTLLGYPRQQFSHPHDRFTLENGARQLARHFNAVARYDVPSALHFPEVSPALDYLDSTRDMLAPELPEAVSWAEFMDVIEKQIQRLIRRDGELRVRKLAGALVATQGGGFARDYMALLNHHD